MATPKETICTSAQPGGGHCGCLKCLSKRTKMLLRAASHVGVYAVDFYCEQCCKEASVECMTAHHVRTK